MFQQNKRAVQQKKHGTMIVVMGQTVMVITLFINLLIHKSI